MSWFAKKKNSVNVTVNLNMRLQLKDRQDLLEKPLEIFLTKKKIGVIAAANTYLSGNECASSCDLHLLLNDHEYLATVLDELNSLGAAKGSSVQIDETVTPFGGNEGLALFLDTSLSDDIISKHDVNTLFDSVEKVLLGQGRWLSSHMFEYEFALFVYGYSFSRMEQRLQTLFSKEPLLQNARIEQIV